MKREVFFLIGRGGAILWSDASRSPIALPDSRARWEAIWAHRDELEEIAHSHPVGPRAFSREDESTMQAIVSALGKAPRFSVVAPEGMVVREGGAADLWHATDAAGGGVGEEPWWAALLRMASGMA